MIERNAPGDPEPLRRLGFPLPPDYLAFMAASDGATVDLGERRIELWPVAEVLAVASREQRYDGVLLFAGDGANTVYGVDADGEIVEGDWIGLDRDELIRHGRTLSALLELR
jgi:hypothetical protein